MEILCEVVSHCKRDNIKTRSLGRNPFHLVGLDAPIVETFQNIKNQERMGCKCPYTKFREKIILCDLCKKDKKKVSHEKLKSQFETPKNFIFTKSQKCLFSINFVP